MIFPGGELKIFDLGVGEFPQGLTLNRGGKMTKISSWGGKFFFSLAVLKSCPCMTYNAQFFVKLILTYYSSKNDDLTEKMLIRDVIVIAFQSSFSKYFFLSDFSTLSYAFVFLVILSTRIYFSCLYMFVTFITIFFSFSNGCSSYSFLSYFILVYQLISS